MGVKSRRGKKSGGKKTGGKKSYTPQSLFDTKKGMMQTFLTFSENGY